MASQKNNNSVLEMGSSTNNYSNHIDNSPLDEGCTISDDMFFSNLSKNSNYDVYLEKSKQRFSQKCERSRARILEEPTTQDCDESSLNHSRNQQ
jgi:hypothetical protein